MARIDLTGGEPTTISDDYLGDGLGPDVQGADAQGSDAQAEEQIGETLN